MAHYEGITTSHTARADWDDLMARTTPKPIEEVLYAVREPQWQAVRLSLKGTTLAHRHAVLKAWAEENQWSERACIQIRNYITALMRGGMIK